MDKWKKLYQKTTRRVVDLISGNGLMQEENKVEGDGYVTPGMQKIIRACGAEGVVLLKNEKDTLPLKEEDVVIASVKLSIHEHNGNYYQDAVVGVANILC
jgi:beta-glucosidase-like glycosyl hydrolase